MKYSNEEIFNDVKEIIMLLFGYLNENNIVKDADLTWNLGFDENDKRDIIIQLEAKHGGFVPFTKSLKNAVTLGKFCDILCDEMNKQQSFTENIVMLQNNKNSLFNRIKKIITRQK